MRFRFSIFLFCFLFVAPVLCAQSAEPPPSDEQNETMRDTLKRMQIKREEQEHKKILDKGALIKTEAENLAKEAVGNTLPRNAEKKLREIEKSARQIRSEFGGGGNDDEALESPPDDLAGALKRLSESGEKLNKELGKTSRHVISFAVIRITSEVIQLTRNIRGYLF
ncbi:MAG: hypothetical protein ACREEM_47320 [Blastocatellia bacterium]